VVSRRGGSRTTCCGDEGVRGITIVAREVVTERTDRHAKRGTERRLDAAFDGASIGMALIGMGGRFLRVNPALCALLGFRADELIGRIASDLAHPDELDHGLEALAAIASGTLESPEDERRMRRRDDTHVWVRMAISLVRDDAGAPLYFATQVIDLSERVAAEEARRAQEEQYRLIVENTQQCVWADRRARGDDLREPRGRRAARVRAGRDPRATHLRLHGRRGARRGRAHLERRRDGKHDRNLFRLRHRHGHDVWIEADSSPLTDARGASTRARSPS